MELLSFLSDNANASTSTVLIGLIAYLIKLHRSDLNQHRKEYMDVVKLNTEAITKLAEGVDHLSDKIK